MIVLFASVIVSVCGRRSLLSLPLGFGGATGPFYSGGMAVRVYSQ